MHWTARSRPVLFFLTPAITHIVLVSGGVAADMNLTSSCLEMIMNGIVCDKPVVQVLGQKRIHSQQSPDRYRLLLSDGVYSISSAMLGTQLNDKVTSGEIDSNSIIRLDKYICNVITGDKKVLVLLEVTVLAVPSVAGGKIGNPQPYKQPEGGVTINHNVPSTNTVTISTSNNFRAMNISSAPISNATAFINSGNFNKQSGGPSNQSKTYSSFGNTHGQLGSSSVTSQFSASNNAETPSKISPIAGLSPYHNRWTIKARVTQKSAIKTWSNTRGEGQLFSFNLRDESGEIRATAFKNEVAKFYNMIEVNKVYMLRKAVVKVANKQYCTFNDYELSLTGETEIIPCDEDASIPSGFNFSFVPISQLQDIQPGTIIDVIGVVKEFDDIKVFRNNQGRESKKRDLTLVDQSLVQIRLTIWGADAESFDGSGFPIIAVKGCKVSDWGGRSLGQAANCQLIYNPDIPESHSLRGWFDNAGNRENFMEFKREGGSQTGQEIWKTFMDVKAQNLAVDKADYFSAKATISAIKKENCLYMACPQLDCNKKVVDNGNGMYRCEKCAKEFGSFKWRLMLQMNLSDFTENIWVTCFQDCAEIILGRKADEMGQMRDMNPTEFDCVFNEANFSNYIFKFRSKMETYNDESRLKTVCIGCTPINHVDYSTRLLSEIEKIIGTI